MSDKPTSEISELLPDSYQELRLTAIFRVIRFDGDEYTRLATYETMGLSKSQKTVLNRLLLVSSKAHAVLMTKLFEDLKSDGLSYSSQTFRRILAELRDKKILKQIPLMHNGQALPQAKIICFESLDEFAKFRDEQELQKLNAVAKSDKRQKDIASQNLSLKARNMPLELRRADEKFYPSGVIVAEQIIPREVKELSPARPNGIRKIGKTFDSHGGAGKYQFEATATTQVPTENAISTLIVIVNLAVAYNSKMLSQKKFSTPFEESEFPVHILDILNVKGIKDSGQARDRIREHILWISETFYYITDLEGVFKNDNLDHIYSQNRFQFFREISSNADETPEIVNGSAIIKPNLYFISLNETIEKVLKQSDTFFAVPWSLLKVDTLVLFFYMFLRRRQVSNEIFDLEFIREDMSYEGTLAVFKEKLEEGFCKAGFVAEDGEAFDFNVGGYYITTSVTEDGTQQYKVVCVDKEMMTLSGSQYNEAKGKLNAPTIRNPLKTVHELKDSINKRTKYADFVNMFVDPSSLRMSLYRILHFGDGVAHCVSRYDNEDYKNLLVELVVSKVDLTRDEAREFIDVLRSAVNFITYQDLVVTQDDFEEFRKYLDRCTGLSFGTLRILQKARSYRKKKITTWLEKRYVEIAVDFMTHEEF